jgi:hypothetical protein
MGFIAHGSVELREEGQILIAGIGGPWNNELIELYRNRVTEHVPALAGCGAWGLVIEISGTASCPPDAVESIRAGMHEHADKWNRVCTAYVIAPDVVGYRILDRVWQDIYAGVMPFRIFEKHDDALRWTRSILAQHKLEPVFTCPDRNI